MKAYKLLALFIVPAGLRAFAPQPYYTAEINPGEVSLTCAAEVGCFDIGFFEFWSGLEVSPQLSFRYSPTGVGNGAFFIDGGGFFEWAGWGDVRVPGTNDLTVTPNGAIGFQFEIIEKSNLTAAISAEYPYLISLILMQGFQSKNLGHETVTIGVKTFTFIPSMFFVNIHPTPRFHFNLGASYVVFGGEVHAGLAYTFGNLGVYNESN